MISTLACFRTAADPSYLWSGSPAAAASVAARKPWAYAARMQHVAVARHGSTRSALPRGSHPV